MALMAFFAQMFLSKVAFMSGAALLLAKIALLFSALVSELPFFNNLQQVFLKENKSSLKMKFCNKTFSC